MSVPGRSLGSVISGSLPGLVALTGLCCFGFTGLSSLAVVLGLTWVRTHIHPLLYVLLPLNLLVLAFGWRRHGNPRPLVAAFLGSPLLLYGYHNALEVWLLLTALYGGSALLLAAALLELWTQRRCRPRRGVPG